MKHALRFFGTTVLIVVLSSFAFADDGVLIGDKTPPAPGLSAERQSVTYPGLAEVVANLLTGLLYLP
jgi:hypothetical protein